MDQSNSIAGIDQSLLADSYVLRFSRREMDIVIEMEFTLAAAGLGHMIHGQLIFPVVDKEEWHRDTGETASLEIINELAHRYQSGPNSDGSCESPDIGCINSITFTDGHWQLVGDWGYCSIWTKNAPRLIFLGNV